MIADRKPSNLKRSVGYGVVAGAALGLAVPGPDLWPLALLFPGLLLEALRGETVWWRGGLVGWVAGTVHWLIAVPWVVEVLTGYGGLPVVAGWLSLLLMAMILGSTWAAVALLTVRCSQQWRLWMVPAAWVVLEVVRRYPPFLFPWNTAASVFSGRPTLLAALPTWGVSGQGWALVALGCAMWALMCRTTRRAGMGLLAVVLPLQIAAVLVAPSVKPGSSAISFAVIQPGTTLEERWDPTSWPETTERVWRLSAEVGREGPDVLLWPESAMPYQLDSDAAFRQQIQEFARHAGTSVVLNSVAGVSPAGYSNSAFAVTPEGSISRYDKMRLVPFGEYVPSWAKWFFPDSLVHEVSAFTPGREARPLDVGVPLGMAVCYEIVFPGLAVRQVREGAQVLATLTNDAWYGDSWALDQHFAQAVLRAVETRRWVVRAALTGISGVIDPYGRIVTRIEAGVQGSFVEQVFPSRQLTPVVRFGDWWAYVCAVMVIAGQLFSRRSKSPRSKKSK